MMTRKNLRLLFAASVVVASACWLLLFFQSRSLSVPKQLADGSTVNELPANILAFEFAWTDPRAEEIRSLWQTNGLLEVATAQLRLDFIFLLLYPTAVALGCLLARRHLGRHSWLATAGRILPPAQVLTAGFDAVENLALLQILGGAPGRPAPDLAIWAATAGICATLKFSLLLAGIAYGVAGFVSWRRHRD